MHKREGRGIRLSEIVSGKLESLSEVVGCEVEVAVEGVEANIHGRLVAVSPEGWFVRAQSVKVPRGLLTHTAPGPDPDSPLVFIPYRKILVATVGQKLPE